MAWWPCGDEGRCPPPLRSGPPHSVLQVDPSRTPAPRHVWSRHTLPITDLHCGFGGPLARVATSSLDQTVKVGSPPHPKWIRESCCGRGQVLGQREPVNRLHPQAGSCRQLLIPRCFRLKDVQRVDGAGPCRLGNSHLAACAWQLPGQTAGDLRAPGLGALPLAGPPTGHAGVVDATARVCPREGPEGGGCGSSPPGAQGLLVRAASVPRAPVPPAVGGLFGRAAAVCAL